MKDYWKLFRLEGSPEGDNKYLNPKNDISADEDRQDDVKRFIALENIFCIDSKGNIFEDYAKLLVSNDIERNDDNIPIEDTLESHVRRLGDKDMFMPSFALTCNIIAELYKRRSEKSCFDVQHQYRQLVLPNRLEMHGSHLQNTAVNWLSRTIVHYPEDQNRNSPANKSKKELNFNNNNNSPMIVSFKYQLAKHENREYFQNLTGLKKPEILNEIAEYFASSPIHKFTKGNLDTICRLGCITSQYFHIDCESGMYARGWARGVKDGDEQR